MILGIFSSQILGVLHLCVEKLLEDGIRLLWRGIRLCNTDDYPDAADHEPWLERQSTDINSIWEERFRAELITRTTA